MTIKRAESLVQAALDEIETLTVEQAHQLWQTPAVTFVDLRDIRELQREGTIAGALHAPRGMLEFWIDPASPYYREAFGSGDRFVFYCQSGWRSALATQAVQAMGLQPVCHIDGGFRAWQAAGLPVTELAQRR